MQDYVLKGRSKLRAQRAKISFLSATDQFIEEKFSIVHYNVQSIVNKMDLIQSVYF